MREVYGVDLPFEPKVGLQWDLGGERLKTIAHI